MPSPFPGMDPYIETRREWPDFHNSLAEVIRTNLNMVLQDSYYATTTTYATYDIIEIAQSDSRSISPDVSVWRTVPLSSSTGGVAVIDPPAAQSQK